MFEIKIDLGKIDYLYNHEICDIKKDGIYFYIHEYYSQYDDSRFLNKIIIKKDNEEKVLFREFSDNKLNLFDIFYKKYLNVDVLKSEEETETIYTYFYDYFFNTYLMFSFNDIIFLDENFEFKFEDKEI